MRRHATAAGRGLVPVLAIVALMLLSPRAAWAQSATGPWVQTKNGYYASGRLAWGNVTSYYDADGNVVVGVPPQTLKRRVIDFETEYGISNRLTLRLGLPLYLQSFDLPSVPYHSTSNGFGNLLWGFKYGFLDPAGKSAVALEVVANTPTGYNPFGVAVPPVGNGKFSADGHLRAGITLDPTPVYTHVNLGYRKYTDSDYSSSVLYGAEVGIFATPRLLVLADLDAAKGSDDTKLGFSSFTRVEGLVQYGLKSHLDVMAGYRRTVSGKDTDKSSELRLGVALKGNGLGRYRGQSSSGMMSHVAAKMVPAPVPAPAPAVPAPAIPAPAPAPSDTTKTPEQPK